MRRHRLILALLVLVTGHLLATPQAAQAAGGPILEATYTAVNNGWARVQRWSDPDPNFTTEHFPSDGRGDQSGDRLTYFGGTARPGSGKFLLYSAPGWNTNPKAVPVLLVLGATQNADQAWANPNLNGAGGCGNAPCPTTGLMQALAGAGYKVFAVNFAHSFGDNYQQAQVIADAIEVIRGELGVPQVDLLAWSKGVLAARMYVSGVKPPWGRPYQNDVRKLILLGGPNKGMDTPYRHGIQNMGTVWPECGGNLNFPIAASTLFCFGAYYTHPELTYSGTGANDAYPGARQALYRWDNVYALDTSWADWYTVYYGGWGAYSFSPGIDTAINQGSLITTMRAAPSPASVGVYLLCGGYPTLPTSTENTGPSDGVVFVASCTDTGGLTTVADSKTLWFDNHVMLGWEANAVNQIKSWLA
ncbi:hypothetical protein [Catellatospora tritici]|uniref:hypothetical protein n=1 Tax=Catellatospora tritici TaxID=2851566 RepID=UPI001C2D8700|nr:hypothetical protein [Catellatospora tritici]MBV1849956.1 hypothetical protein [Catellatospora tritici]